MTAYLELCVVVLASDQVHYARQPSLFFYCLFRLLRSSLNRPSRVSCRLLDTLSNEDFEDL
jgi:hypothetical protein